MWPAWRSGLARSSALRLSTSTRLGLRDRGLGLGDGGRGTGEFGVVLRQLRVERVGDQAREHVALLHARAFIRQHLGDAQAFDLGPDQDLLARHQRAGGEHRLGEVGGGHARHGDNRSNDVIGGHLGGLARVRVAEWNAGSNATVDTRLTYRKSLDSFFDQLDGSVWRSPDGLTKQTLRLGFREILGDTVATTPLTIAGEATFEAAQGAAPTLAAASGDSRRVGVETRVAGLMSSFVTADRTR